MGVATAAALLLTLAVAAPAPASPYVHAHRGGPLHTTEAGQVPRFPEDTLPGYAAAAADGYILETDVKLTSGGVPVILHDATLDRTTNCTGRVNAISAADLRAKCEVDIVGTTGNVTTLDPGDPRRTFVPTLAEFLDLAKDTGATINLEIKNIPTDPDFDATGGYATTVAEAIEASGFPPSRMIVQSFWPPNLDVIEADPYFDLAQTSLLTLQPMNAGAPAFADANGYEWVSPAWPIDPSAASTAAFIADAHARGLQVVPYTLDQAQAVEDAARAGVDAIISNDPGMARAAIAEVAPAPSEPPPPPSTDDCEQTSAKRTAPPITAYDAQPGAPRVFAMQFKQELRHVVSYESFRTKIECMVLEYVVPRMVGDRPNVIAFNEDVGLMTLATGSRGAAARRIFEDPDTAPQCQGAPAPCGAAAAIAAARAGYTRELAAYAARYPDAPPVGTTFLAGTDTFARGWMQVFSDIAKRYGVYILGSNNQAPFRASVDPTEIPAFADPDLPTPESVYVATTGVVYNEVFMWGPEDVREEGPPMLRNVVAQNKKVPLTAIEQTIQVTPGPNGGPDAIENLRPYSLPGTGAKIGFATSLPAFVWTGNDGTDFGQPLDAAIDPCADVSQYYMRCLDLLGTNLVMQDEANGGGAWTATSGEGAYQPLEWMRSTWRTAGDPTASFTYNVTPFMVGNLADLAFDGQTSITQRGLATGDGCTYVGNSQFIEGSDPERLRPFAGPKKEFIAITPWVRPDGPRPELQETSAKLNPGSGDPIENDYLETAIVADLPFPPDPSRPSCVASTNGDSGPPPGGEGEEAACTRLLAGKRGDDRLVGSARSERLRGRGGDDQIRARAGDDCLGGGGGDDDLDAGGGDDRARGGPGRDRIRCGPGDDVAFAQRGERVAADCEQVNRR